MDQNLAAVEAEPAAGLAPAVAHARAAALVPSAAQPNGVVAEQLLQSLDAGAQAETIEAGYYILSSLFKPRPGPNRDGHAIFHHGVALLCGFDTPSLTVQGGQRLLSYFNIDRDIPMQARITILIPNYNRPKALERLLHSVFASIEHADAVEKVFVLVVDDYSEQDVMATCAPFANKYPNFLFKLQRQKCGNGEVAFFSALQWVETKYTWLLGNDDFIAPESVGYLVDLIYKNDFGFVLLNPTICVDHLGSIKKHLPFTVSTPSVVYERVMDLFRDFGFVTATTTFTCLFFRTEPVKKFHAAFNISQYSRVYSHSFSIFSALRDHRGIFLRRPLVEFTHNRKEDEHEKLTLQAPEGIVFFHHTIGLARLIDQCSKITHLSIEQIGQSFEYEIDKDTLHVYPTLLSHFVVAFSIQQLRLEINNFQHSEFNFGHLSKNEHRDIHTLICNFADPDLIDMFALVDAVFLAPEFSPNRKMEFLQKKYLEILELAKSKHNAMCAQFSTSAPRKIFSNMAVSTRGQAGDEFGYT